jgi:hypothetical protein
MTIAEYAELMLLRKRAAILEQKLPLDAEYPEVEFALKEVEDLEALISTLKSVGRVYGE